MKNKLKCTVLIAFLTLLTSTGSAQQKGYIGISVGPSIPIGDLASIDVYNEKAGFSRGGLVFDINYARTFGEYFGLTVLLRGQANGVDDIAFADAVRSQTGSTWRVSSKPYSIGGFMFGAYGAFPISEKVSFDARAMLGFLSATSPDLTITLSGSGGQGWIKQSSVSSFAFTTLLGGGFRFDVGKKTSLLFNLDYLRAKPEFRNVEITSSNGGAPDRQTYSQIYETINLGIGVGLRL